MLILESYGVIFTTRQEYVWFFGTLAAQGLIWLSLRMRHGREWVWPQAVSWSEYRILWRGER